MRKTWNLMTMVVISLLALVLVNAAPIPVEVPEVQINGNSVNVGEFVSVEEGSDVDVQVKLRTVAGAVDENGLPLGEVKNVELEASIRGYEYSAYEPLTDVSSVFDMEAGTTYFKTLSLQLPTGLDKDLYLLRLRVTDKNSDEVVKNINLRVKPVRHGVQIEDVVFSPGTTVKAGKSVLATVLLENVGAKDEDDVKVTFSIDDLGVSAADFVDVESGDSEASEELFVRLPDCAEAGEYTAQVTAQFDRFESVSKTFTMNVLENEQCRTAVEPAERLMVTVGPEKQTVSAGQQATYPIAVANAGNEARTYTFELTAGDWATASLSRNLVVLQPGQTEIVYAYVTAASKAQPGDYQASFTVRAADGNVLETIPLSATVTAGQRSASAMSLRNGLEIALIVLVVLLVVVGLVIGFSRLKRDDEEEQTYY